MILRILKLQLPTLEVVPLGGRLLIVGVGDTLPRLRLRVLLVVVLVDVLVTVVWIGPTLCQKITTKHMMLVGTLLEKYFRISLWVLLLERRG
mmetsp:Transcript_28664/g.80001  ORF Transcript_28664/g.80001 Transcript_28664/m.80001 type:complete len:92 (-) Transcript_28664:31-306(-)